MLQKLFSIILLFVTCCYTLNVIGDSKLEYCQPMSKLQNSNLQISYQEFDQTQGKGWRLLAKHACFIESAKLIENYLAMNSTLEVWQKANLYFHAGQMYAVADEYELAIVKFNNAFWNYPKQSPVHWNEYVLATIAFLQKDKVTLIRYRKIMAQTVGTNQPDPNLPVVDNMIKHFDKPYKYVYHLNSN